MAIELKETILHIRKGVMFSIRISYKSAHAHPYIAGFLFLLLILHSAFPSLYNFLISSSPVIVCTAILLGTLLSYGTPNIPEIEEEDKKTQETSSLQSRSAIDDVVMQKEESCTVETHLETDTKTNERAVKEAVGEASHGASNEVERDVPSAQIHNEGNCKNNTVLTASLLLEEDKKEMQGEMKVGEEREVMDYGFVKEREFSIENEAELAVEDSDIHNVAVHDQNELEGLRIQIAKPLSDSPFDSSLGSPWQPVNACYPSSGSDSDGAESSSPDASMADIIPMLDELHPLLDSLHPQPTLRASDNSDVASSGFSQDSESESGTTEHEVENKENAETQEKEDTNDVLVPWTTDDQKIVMDLGYIEAERNCRLENLIARRRLRKLQRFETQKNLIDIDSLYPSSIPPISAPRQNPFDVPHDFGGPGSAPSVMQPIQNPFDLPCDQVGEVCILSREYLSHHDFISAGQREMASQKLESSTAGPSFSGDSNQENKGLKLKSRFVSEGIDSEETGAVTFERQFASQKDQELIEPEINQESTKLSPITNDAEQIQQDRQSFKPAHFGDNKHEWSPMDDTDCATDFNTSVNTEETNLADNDFRVMEEEIGVVEDNLPVSDTGKLEVLEERYEDSDSSSSSEENKMVFRFHIHEESADPEMSRDEPIQSELVDIAQAVDLLCDSGPSAIGKAHPYISTHDETLLYEGLENFIASPLPSDLQVDLPEVASPPRPYEASLPLEDHSIDVDKSGQYERNDMINEPASVDESAVPLSPKVGIGESPVRSFDVHSISEEILENFIPEVEHKNVMHPSASSGLTASQVVEESNVCMFDIEQEPSISQEAAEEIDDNDLVIRLAPEGKDSDASGGSLIPTHDGGFPGSQFHELTGSVEFSARLEMKSEHDMGFSSDLSDVQSKGTNEILSKKEEGFLIDLNNLGKESDDDVHADVAGIKDIDESLLSEIEAVGDYRVERELKSDQGDSNLQLGQFNCVVEGSGNEMQYLSVVEGSGNEMQYLSNRLQDSSLLPFGEDPEMTVYNSKLHFLEVYSVDELNSIFKEHSHEEAVVLPASDLTLENSVTSQTKRGDKELGIANRDKEPTATDMELLVLEAKSDEDFSSALKQHSEGLNEASTSEVEVLTERACLEPEEINSDLHVIAAKSLHNINLALKPLSEVAIRSPPEQLLEDLHPEVADVQSSEASASERHHEPENIEVQSAQEINLDSVEATPRQMNMVTEQGSETEHGNAAAADVSSSTLKKIRKKKSSKCSSDPSSSSSSSSSDSD